MLSVGIPIGVCFSLSISTDDEENDDEDDEDDDAVATTNLLLDDDDDDDDDDLFRNRWFFSSTGTRCEMWSARGVAVKVAFARDR